MKNLRRKRSEKFKNIAVVLRGHVEHGILMHLKFLTFMIVLQKMLTITLYTWDI